LEKVSCDQRQYKIEEQAIKDVNNKENIDDAHAAKIERCNLQIICLSKTADRVAEKAIQHVSVLSTQVQVSFAVQFQEGLIVQIIDKQNRFSC
jgi:hypothetical protein